MNYITHHRFKQKTMEGKELNLPYGTPLTCENDILYYNKTPICYHTSENAKHYFSRNDDNKGLERGKLTYSIAFAARNKKQGYRFTEKERNLITEKYSHWLIREVDFILFNNDFFAAEIEDLQKLYNELGGK